MARIQFAQWRPIGRIEDEPPITPTVLIFHTMAGFLMGTEATFKAQGFHGVESTFGVGGPADGKHDGALVQWQDTPPSKRSKRPLPEDGIFGVGTIAALQRRLRIDDDGIMGPATRVQLEIDLGIVRPDGLIAGGDVKALQARVGVPKNGIWDQRTTRALQRALNAGTF